MNASGIMKAVWSGLVLLAWPGVSLLAQPDNSHVAPKPVPQVATPAAPVPPSPTSHIGLRDNDLLVDNLKSLVFVPTPASINKGGTSASARGVVLEGVTVPSEDGFRKVTSVYLGQRITGGKLNDLISDIILFYRNHDRPVVDVIVPDQEITNGGIQIVLLEGKVGKMTVAGNRWFSSSQIADGVAVQPGESISQRQIQGDLDWLNENPFRTTSLVYTPGEKIGQTDLVLQTHDRFPVRVYAGYEDSGNAPTGFDRYLAGVNFGDLFRIGQQLNYQYTTSGDGDSLRAHALSYIIPLPWHHTLTFFGNYVDTKGEVPPLIDLVGRSYQISGRYSIPLPTFTLGSVTYKHEFAAGFDYKYNKNSLAFGGFDAADTLYDVDQFAMGYTGTETDPYGQLTINDQLYVSPGNWGGNNNDMAFAATHGGANSDYVYNTLILQRLTKLPKEWTLVLRGTLQTSNANLMPSEQLGFGGYDTVRGYDEREVNTDDGYIFTTELRTPTLSVGDICHLPAIKDQLQLLAFWDTGSAYNHAALPGEPDQIGLSSIGFGVRYSINTYLTVRYDYGFQLVHTGFDNDQGSRSDLGIVLSY
jgi:hemolysin activation/secretion protein